MSSSYAESITIDQLDADPYPIYARLRQEAPVAWVPATGAYLITPWQLCADTAAGAFGITAPAVHPTLSRVFGNPNILTTSGRAHAELRQGVDARLQPDRVTETIDGLVRPLARRRIDALAGRTSADLMADYFEPISVEALRSVMGLDEYTDADTLRRWFADLNVGIANFGMSPELFAIADATTAEIRRTLAPVFDRYAARPDDSMISHMMWAGREGGTPRTAAEILPTIEVILLGGMQEPGHAAATTLLGLFSRPEQLAMTVDEPTTWIPAAVNEGLRWIAPVGLVSRQTSVEATIEGVTIPADAIVEIMIGSANRDETRFAEPDRFDLERSTGAHQSFGGGEHFCAGHFFARQVERIMLEELLGEVRGLRPAADDATRVTGWVFRAPRYLPVEWDAVESRDRIELGGASTSVDAATGERALRVVGMRRESEAVLAVELEPTDGEVLPEWAPGAHIDLRFPDSEHIAQYSLCGSPTDRRWTIAVRREEDSRGVSRTVHDSLRVGEIVATGGPRNHFALDDADLTVFIAGGIGITPILPMLERLDGAGAEWTLLFAGHRSTVPFLDRLRRYGDRVRTFVSEEGRRIDIAAEMASLAGRDDVRVYACGPARMLDQVVAEAQRHGVTLRTEHFEGVENVRAGDRSFDIELARQGRTITVDPNEPAVAALRRAGVQVRTSCEQGNCGSCETAVLAGRIEHRDLVLTPGQRERGDRMMVCVSRAADESIELDL